VSKFYDIHLDGFLGSILAREIKVHPIVLQDHRSGALFILQQIPQVHPLHIFNVLGKFLPLFRMHNCRHRALGCVKDLGDCKSTRGQTLNKYPLRYCSHKIRFENNNGIKN